MSWEKTTLGTIIDIKKGKAITKKDSKEGPYPVILGGREPAYYIDQFNHTGKAIVVSRSGASAGYVSFWDEAIFVTDGFLIEPKESVDIDYLYYLMKAHEQELMGLQGGSAIPHVTPKIIGGISIDLPDVDLQRKISEVLKSYDDLIENNKNQIKLLEEAAQRLYKEWFVDLRFPGYEGTEIVDGVPEGWKKHHIDDVFHIKYGKTLPTSKITKEGKYPVYGANGVIGFYLEKNVDDYVVLITSRGNGSGDVLRTHDKESFVTNNSFIVKPYDHSIRLPFIHQLMKNTDFKNICTGSAQPQLTNNSISTLLVLLPSCELISQFCDIESSWYEKIEMLLTLNRLLSQARDRLLPKLMSGEIEV